MMLKKNIYFILPGYSRRPIGGYKIVFKYANKLAKDGYNVNIVYIENPKRFPKYSWKWLWLKYSTKNGPHWIKLNKNIKKISIKNGYNYFKNDTTDIAVASSVETVVPTKELFPNAKKFYLIQDLEDWNVSREFLIKTYNTGFTNITISKWLKDFVTANSKNKTMYIRNPIDIKSYFPKNAIEKRNSYIIGMLYHAAPYKGSDQTLAILKELKQKYPLLKILMFGTRKKPKNLPNWITYYKNASQNKTIEIYNSIGIFVCGTIKEGFGLTGLEAMACGATLVSTNYLGVRDYAINNVNSLLSPVNEYRSLKSNLEMVMNNKELRIKLASAGVKTAQKFSWDEAYVKFKEIILKDK
ncbi:glycosyltransferase family 4 protein [Lactobacillus sp. PSON]|uniref:glycosyltransferase family 4 protein n=1 Tax=Lactobacillus sp. PSON TaxID=3455454 RepID=UPI004041E5D9